MNRHNLKSPLKKPWWLVLRIATSHLLPLQTGIIPIQTGCSSNSSRYSSFSWSGIHLEHLCLKRAGNRDPSCRRPLEISWECQGHNPHWVGSRIGKKKKKRISRINIIYIATTVFGCWYCWCTVLSNLPTCRISLKSSYRLKDEDDFPPLPLWKAGV